jgi:secondary thiamine-phosphate synthase enzyme
MGLEEFSVRTDRRLQVVDVTDSVRALVPDDATGTVTVFSQHTTAAVTINEAEDRLVDDIEEFLSNLVIDEGWAHDEIDDNADSHLRAGLLGPSETIPVVDGTLQLGTWQSVLLVECDGPRSRTLVVAD